MSLPHALLGLVSYHPATGYDLGNTFKRSIHFFWNATLPQIYRTLNQMETKNWVTSTVEHQDGKPSRKVYHITEAGQAEFRRWLAEPPERIEPRIPMLLKVFFGNRLSRDQFAQQIRQYRDYCAILLEQYEREVPPIIEHYSRLTGAAGDAHFWGFSLDFGKRQVRMGIDWAEQTLKDIEKKGMEVQDRGDGNGNQSNMGAKPAP
jgi:PadR family transcriptional regulator, regulatory protein AphA